MRKGIHAILFAGIFIAVCAVVAIGASHSAHAFYAVDDCEGPELPGQKFDLAYDYDAGTVNATPRNNQFWCSPSTPLSPPSNVYQCEETTTGARVCRHYLNPATDFYTCTYFGGGPQIGSTPYPGVVFDNCTHSIVPPTVSLSAAPSTVAAGNSTTLTWTVVNATSCTSSWAGAIAGASGSQTVTPPATTSYSLTCSGPGGTTGPVNTTVTVIPPPDTTPPTDPAGLSASAVSTSQINLSWTASTDSGGSGLAGYRIERCAGTGCAAFVQIGLSAAASYSDTGLTPATTYTYRVRAYDNATNISGYSNTASATTWTPPDTTPPTAPFLSGSPFSSTQIDLSWTASTDSGSGLSDYRVYRGGTLIATLGTSITAYSDVGLTPSTLYSYYVVARDVAGNSINSNTVSITTPAPPDTTPPTFTFSAPAMTLPSGTTSATLAGSTNETAACRYSTTSGLVFTSMTLFPTTGGLSHSQPSITGLTDGTIYTYYVKCRDGAGNTNTTDFSYMFQVSSPAPDMTPPVISGGAPTGVLGAGTTSATISVVTNENAYCRYNQGSDVAYGSMTNAFSSTGATNHSATLTGLTNGASYIYFVRCQDNPAGNENAAGYAVAFSVATPANVNPVALIVVAPGTSGSAPFIASADGSGSYDTDGTIVQYIWTWGDGSPDTLGTPTASHTYTGAGTYIMTLRVIDNQGGSGTTTQSITVSAAALPPPPAPAVSFCVAACTTDADCASSGGVCSLSGVCVAAGSVGGGPVRSNGYLTLFDGTMSQPTPAVFPSSTKSVIMSLETDVNAECQYTTFINTPYDGSAMETFSSTGSTKHAVTLTGITGTLTTSTTTTPKTYDYYVRCKDSTTGDVNTSDYPISFTITGATVVSGPNPYTCLINKNLVKNNIPYLFDICVPK